MMIFFLLWRLSINSLAQRCQSLCCVALGIVAWGLIDRVYCFLQTRPSDLLTNFFGRKPQQRSDSAISGFAGYRSNPVSQSSNPIDGGVSLIDLSPPGSPTFTTRSSSDGVSVDSFGSDGNSNPSIFTSSGNTSQTESAFEDDFDFFGSLNSGKSTTNDPWKVGAGSDPFAPIPSSNVNSMSSTTKRVGDARFFAHNDTAVTGKTIFDQPIPSVAPTMPTIIRARPPKPPAPKIGHRSLAPIVTDFSAGASSSSSLKINVPQSSSTVKRLGLDNEWPTFDDNPSPPMPSIPPPAPPVEYLTDIDDPTPVHSSLIITFILLDCHARCMDCEILRRFADVFLSYFLLWIFNRLCKTDETVSYNIQSDLESTLDKTESLPHKITPFRGVRAWLTRAFLLISRRQLIFFSLFQKHIVQRPLGIALYDFAASQSGDLSLKQGDRVELVRAVNDEWLEGRVGNRSGIFPANFVDVVVPLSDSSNNIVNALYSFAGETWEDLSFEVILALSSWCPHIFSCVNLILICVSLLFVSGRSQDHSSIENIGRLVVRRVQR